MKVWFLHVGDIVLDLLENRKWHDLTEIADKIGLHGSRIETLTNFLSNYGFIELDKAKRKVRLAVSVVDFLKKTKYIEKDEGESGAGCGSG